MIILNIICSCHKLLALHILECTGEGVSVQPSPVHSKSISNGVTKCIKISIIESGTIKIVFNGLSILGIFFCLMNSNSSSLMSDIVHPSNIFFYYNNRVLNKKMLKDM